MDKMTHTKFNLNNFLLAISDGIDCAVEKNENCKRYNSKRVAFITLKIASFNDFTKSNLSDILSFCILMKHYENYEDIFNIFPFLDKEIFDNQTLQEILKLSETIERHINLEDSFVLNKRELTVQIEDLEIDEIIKENFFYLAEFESFWLDLVSPRIPFFILDMLEDTTIEIEYEKLFVIAKEVSKIVYKYAGREFDTRLIDNLLKMCKVYNFDNKDTSRVLLSGYLYNIGMLKVSQSILLKNESLNDLEYDKIKAVPYYTKEILSMIFGFDDITKLSSNYSEKIDGSGYPFQIDGSELALKDRLLAILCIFQALSEERNYRKVFTKDEAFTILDEEVINGRLDGTILKDIKAVL